MQSREPGTRTSRYCAVAFGLAVLASAGVPAPLAAAPTRLEARATQIRHFTLLVFKNYPAEKHFNAVGNAVRLKALAGDGRVNLFLWDGQSHHDRLVELDAGEEVLLDGSEWNSIRAWAKTAEFKLEVTVYRK